MAKSSSVLNAATTNTPISVQQKRLEIEREKLVRGGSAKRECLHLNAQKRSSRRAGKRDEFGNPGNRDIELEISQESSRLQAPGVSN